MIVAGLGVWALVLAQAAADPSAVGADQLAPPPPAAAVSADEVTGATGQTGAVAGSDATKATRRLTATEQVGRPRRAVGPSDQIAPAARTTAAPAQLTTYGRTASAPPPLSSRRDSQNVGVVTVHGHDRCDPVKGEATREECAAILDYRADEFARPEAPGLTPEDALVGSPPSSDLAADATAARRLSGPEGADPSVAAAAAAVEGSPEGAQAAAVGATDRTAPAVPAGTFPTLPTPPTTGPTVTVTGPK